jgi:hypothetical protein
MNQVTVNDLDFCSDHQDAGTNSISGGAKYLAGYTTSLYTDRSATYVAVYSIDKNGYRAVVGGEVVGVVAGAAGGAIAVGKAQIAVFATASGGII